MASDGNVPKHLSSLPEEVLIRIFDHLKGSDLLNASLICRKFNGLISTTPHLMDKLLLRISLDDMNGEDECFEFLNSIKLEKHHRNVRFSVATFGDDENGELDYVELSDESAARITTLICPIITSIAASLTTLSLYDIRVLPEFMIALSLCEQMESITFLRCNSSTDDASLIQTVEFKKLRVLRLTFSSAIILAYFKCVELEKFMTSGAEQYYNQTGPHEVIKFLNRLTRCDSVVTDIYFNAKTDGSLNVPFEPKFKWNKLRWNAIQCEANNENEIATISALCQASSVNAEACVELLCKNNENELRALRTIIKNCSRITELHFLGSEHSFPSMITVQTPNIHAVTKLGIDHSMLAEDNFRDWILRLVNVKHLQIQRDTRGWRTPPIPSEENLLILQPFFDRITELSLSRYIMEQLVNANIFMSRVQFKNLKKLNIEIKDSSWTTSQIFENFCLRHRSLNHLNVHITPGGKLEECSLINFFEKFHLVSEIKVCGIFKLKYTDEDVEFLLEDIGIGYVNYYHFRLINWRQLEQSEVNIFGKTLNEIESKFFV